jgi:hypothetical protein
MARAKGNAVPKSDDIKKIIESAPGKKWSQYSDRQLLAGVEFPASDWLAATGEQDSLRES